MPGSRQNRATVPYHPHAHPEWFYKKEKVMRRVFVAAAALAVLGFGGTPAFADCATDFVKVRAELAVTKTDVKKNAARTHIAAAEQAQKDKNEKACVDALAKAAAALK